MTDIIKGIPHKLIEVVLGNTAPLASNLDPPSHILGLNLCSLEGSVGNIEVYNEINHQQLRPPQTSVEGH